MNDPAIGVSPIYAKPREIRHDSCSGGSVPPKSLEEDPTGLVVCQIPPDIK